MAMGEGARETSAIEGELPLQEGKARRGNPAPAEVRGMSRVVMRAVDLLDPDPRNARVHSQAQLELIARSYTKFGINGPIGVKPNGERWLIVNGEGRWRAAREILRLKKIPTVDLSHLSETEIREYRLADNKIALMAGWDEEMLRLEAGELHEMGAELIGWDGEIDDLLRSPAALNDMPKLPDGSRAPYQQMTFILHDAQVELVKAALEAAKGKGPFTDEENENSNGNALARIARAYLGR